MTRAPVARLTSALLSAALLVGCGGPGALGTGAARQAGVLATREAGAQPAAAYLDQAAIFPAARALIASAKTDVEVDMFFMGGEIGRGVAEQLIEKHRAGVQVRVMYDPGMGYHDAIVKTVAPVMTMLKQAGVPTRPFPVSKLKGLIPIKADHDKALIVDGRRALVGGMNFADVNAPNHDLMVQVEGPAAIALKRVFKANWTLAGGDPADLMGAWRDWPGAPGEAVEVTTSGLHGTPTRPRLEALIDGARERIWVQMFVLADDRLCDRLAAAAKRGVEVRVLMDPNKFAFAIDLGGMPNFGAVQKFQGTPVQVQLYDTRPGQQMHVKMALFDHDLVATGSTNWTQAGLDTNNETTLVVRSAALNATLAESFQGDWRERLGGPLPSPRVPWFKGKLADWISFLF